MKTIKGLLLAVAITGSSVLMASTSPNANATAKSAEATAITNEISQFLLEPNFVLEKDVLVYATITFNHDNEIVVLSVDSPDETVEEFVKERLNYHKLPFNIYNKKQTFLVPIKLDVEE
ncbi:hypothetical protein [Mangrovimonas sp. YM274]|uniref:hypothetical protein n=1 Tax=Mangrovimonas sp. YM274 TaxID=3070660 RepID=UPI0027DDCD11|nr:hypothetical protein [Mangrovimonas sp. YM274]WMI67857.1 hypothetical protein RBH95_11970 [Mangrovimonas sp. YM274]